MYMPTIISHTFKMIHFSKQSTKYGDAEEAILGRGEGDSVRLVQKQLRFLYC